MLVKAIDLGRMTTDERLVLLDRLLDTLTPDDAFNPSPSWHEEVLDTRVREEQRGDVLFATLEELEAMFKAEGGCRQCADTHA